MCQFKDFRAWLYIRVAEQAEEPVAGRNLHLLRLIFPVTQLRRGTCCRDLTEAKGAIHELHTKIKDVKSKAEQSEMMVQEICRDIKQLDYAKRHLQTTITALKRLHMLVTAVKQLEIMAKDKHYREAANLLDAVSQLLTHFEPYAEIARIRELRETVDQIKKGLTEEIMPLQSNWGLADSVADPAAYDNKMAGDGQFSTLSEACLVVDALGPEAAQRQIDATISAIELVPKCQNSRMVEMQHLSTKLIADSAGFEGCWRSSRHASSRYSSTGKCRIDLRRLRILPTSNCKKFYHLRRWIRKWQLTQGAQNFDVWKRHEAKIRRREWQYGQRPRRKWKLRRPR